MYNELQTGREIHFETKTGICKASIIDPMIYSIIIEGKMKRTIPNNFELFCKYVNTVRYDRTINTIGLPVLIYTGS